MRGAVRGGDKVVGAVSGGWEKDEEDRRVDPARQRQKGV
jgi:hypothetical protein